MLSTDRRPAARMPMVSGLVIAMAGLFCVPVVSMTDLVARSDPARATVTPVQGTSPAAARTAGIVPPTGAVRASVGLSAEPKTEKLPLAASSPREQPVAPSLKRSTRAPDPDGRGGLSLDALPVDVPADHWAAEAVAMLCQIGLMKGYPAKGSNEADGKLRPMGLMSRQEMLKHLPPDVPADHWAAEAVAYLYSLGILEGYPGGTFSRPAEVKPTSKSRRKARFADVPFD